jgi:hypothetical protein
MLNRLIDEVVVGYAMRTVKVMRYGVHFSLAQRPSDGPAPPHCRGFMITDTPQSAGLRTSDQPGAETLTTHNTTDIYCTDGLEPAIPASEWSHTHPLDRTATEISVDAVAACNDEPEFADVDICLTISQVNAKDVLCTK